MRHVSTADLHAHATDLSAAIKAGDEVAVMVDDCEYKLVPLAYAAGRQDSPEIIERRRAALDELSRLRSDLRARGMTVTRDEVRDWINDERP